MSDILIKGMEMPKAQFQKSSTLYHVEGTIFVYPDGKARAELSLDYKKGKSYPLVLVPPHGRLGDLDKLENGLRHMAKYQHGERQQGILGCCETIRLAHTIIPAEPFNNLSKPCKDDVDFPICTKASPASLGIYKKAEEGET